jgi:hypothetical protein
MTVYVDNWRQRACVGSVDAVWSHMFAGPYDDLEELHDLAAKISLLRRWFQDKPWPKEHYDVTETRRQMAIRAGAVSITWEQGGQMRRDARRRNPPTPGSPRPGGEAPLTLF